MGMLLACALASQRIHFKGPPWLLFAMWLGFLVLAVLGLRAKSQQTKKRRAELEQFGTESGFLFSQKADHALAAQLARIRFNVKPLEYTPHYSNVLQGNAGGGDAVIVDRTVGAGKSRSTTTIVAFNMKTPLPAFIVRGENALWHLAEKIGYADIEIDGAPDFSKRFFLHGKDEAAVRALFTPEVTQAFEQLDANVDFQVSVSGPWLVVYRPGISIPGPELRDFLQTAESLPNAFRRALPTGASG